jgi:gliding motility-associated-like protein
VNENCTSPITGNIYCNGATHVTLQAPFGFQGYRWYNADFSSLLGMGYTLRLDPIPPIGTKFAVEVVPYPGLGCLDTLYTTIQLSPEGFYFALMDTARGCVGQPLNLTAPLLSQGSTSNLTFSYFLDSIGLEYLAVPSQVTATGQYYIKAVNTTGCTETKPVFVLLRDLLFNVTDPPVGCAPNTVDITAPLVTAGSSPVLTYSYWKDAATTIALPSPNTVSETGTYYIKAGDGLCQRSKPVKVLIWTDQQLKTNPVEHCGFVNLEDPSVVAGSLPIFDYTFWKDNAGTIAVSDPARVNTSGTYYVKGTLASGCSFIKPVDVTVFPLPAFSITDPDEVTAPQKVDITRTISSMQPYVFTFWLDSPATKPLLSPAFVAGSGRYYIKAADTAGCENILPVNVLVNIPYHPVIKYPTAFSPNKDGVNDRFRLEIAGNITMRTFRIFNRWGQVVFETQDPFEYWQGEKNGKVQPVGTYYWIMELVNNNNNDFYRKTGSITLVR